MNRRAAYARARRWRNAAYLTRAVATHPANRGRRLAALRRTAAWHARVRRLAEPGALVTVDDTTTFAVRPGLFAAVWTLYDGVHEWAELQFCLRLLRPGDHFVDVGANIGVFSCFVGTRSPDVGITAVEPFAPVVAELRANLGRNGVEARVVEGALGAVAGRVSLEVQACDVLNRVATGDPGDSVALTTLDEELGDVRPRLVKIDVEGYELPVLQGAAAHLQGDDPPVLLFEHSGHCRHFGIEPGEIRAFLSSFGYSIHLLDAGLTAWESDDLPPMPNVVATRDVGALRRDLRSPGAAAFRAPVPVSVRWTSPGDGQLAVSEPGAAAR